MECTTNFMVLTGLSLVAVQKFVFNFNLCHVWRSFKGIWISVSFTRCQWALWLHNIVVQYLYYYKQRQRRLVLHRSISQCARLKEDRLYETTEIIIPVVVVYSTKSTLDQWSFGMVVYHLRHCLRTEVVFFCRRLTLTAVRQNAHWFNIAVKICATKM